MKSKHTKKALLMSVVSMFVCMAMLVGSTFAWFTDSVTSGKNKIVAGNLDVELYAKNGDTYEAVTADTNLFMKDALWEPGHVEVVNLKVANAGTLALKYKFGVNVAAEKPGTNQAGETFKLSDYIMFALLEGEQIYESREAAITAAEAKAAALSALAVDEGGELYPAGTEGKASEKFVTLVVYMPTTVANEANYKTDTDAPEIELGVSLVAAQTPFESDSFGEDYDAKAEYPIVADAHYDAKTSEEIISALDQAKEGEVTAIHLKEDVVFDQIGNPEDYWKYHYKISGDKEVIIDLAGNEIVFNKPEGADYSFTGGILADKNSITLVNGIVNVDSCTGIYTTGSATSYFKNVTFNVTGSNSYGVDAVGFTEFDHCSFNVTGGYGVFCARPTKVTNCTFKVNGFGAVGVQMNNHCNGNVISNVKLEVSYGTAIYVNNNSDAAIDNIDITLNGKFSVAGIHVDPEKSFITIGENVIVTNNSTYYSPELVGGNGDLSNIKMADGVTFETDGELYVSKYGASPSAKYEKGTYWRTVSAN